MEFISGLMRKITEKKLEQMLDTVSTPEARMNILKSFRKNKHLPSNLANELVDHYAKTDIAYAAEFAYKKGLYDKAIQLYLDMNRPHKAVNIAEELGDLDRSYKINLEFGYTGKAGENALKLGKTEEAQDLFKKTIVDCLADQNYTYPEYAAEKHNLQEFYFDRLCEIGQAHRAKSIAEKLGKEDIALDSAKKEIKTGLGEGIAPSFLGGEHLANLAEKYSLHDLASLVWEKANKLEKAIKSANKTGDSERAKNLFNHFIQPLLNEHHYDWAAEKAEELGFMDKALEYWKKIEDESYCSISVDKAIDFAERNKYYDMAFRLCEKHTKFKRGAEIAKKAGMKNKYRVYKKIAKK